MNLKTRISLNLSIAFSLIIGVAFSIVYISFSNFRKEEFKDNLESSALFTINYLSRISSDQMRNGISGINVISNNEKDYLLQEKILVFNQNKNLIFSNSSNNGIEEESRLEELDGKNKIFWQYEGKENIGLKTKIKGRDYYIVTQAEDIMGKTKLNFLKIILLITFLVSLAFVWVFSYFFMKKQLKPLDDFKDKITEVTAQQLTIQLPEQKNSDEINVLIKAFNTMVKRLNVAFQSQKEFTASASHEIKTPLTRIAFQLENIDAKNQSEEFRKYLASIKDEVYQLSDSVNSLLILSKVEESPHQSFEEVRLDEAIFHSFEKVKKTFPDFEMDFAIQDQSEEADLTVLGVRSLLEIVFTNLFKNAALYSYDPKASVIISENQNEITVKIINKGLQINDDEISKIYEAFRRGSNSASIKGSGLGLRICKRIMDYHHAKISYHKEGKDFNVFLLAFEIGRAHV